MLKLLTLSTLSFSVFAAKQSKSAIFDNDSEFMKGFETGILMRSKGGDVAEYGCVLPEEATAQFAPVIDTINGALGTVEALLPNDPMLIEAFQMITVFNGSLEYFLVTINPETAKYLDLYCRGMIFGLQGSTMIVKLANIMFDPNSSAAMSKKPPSKKQVLRGLSKLAGNFAGEYGDL